ncbi:MAG: Eco57I restriction-modification methylase domain-containing protein [Prevotella sp.]|nr:Eco57I restriction-modification methylase domain-containing protein [Prevotella sp.]
MKRNVFNQYIKTSNFRELFITEMGWNNPTGATTLPEYTIDEQTFHIEQIAERSGFQILRCKVAEIPVSSLCKKLDTKLRKNAENYICIFMVPDTTHHLWMAPVKKVEKRDVVLVEYDTIDKASFLFEKMEGLSFGFENTLISDVVEKVQAAFLINSEKITKDFYTGFKKEHTNFAKFITGIDDHLADKDNKNKQWYTSVMLNRLMFCYFIQKKGFLDGDVDYLRHKLEWTQQNEGNDSFFNKFYKGFLVNLFHDGLNAPHHDSAFEAIYGRIPYLNGGMFDVHQIEQDYVGLDIADEAFQSLFDFFDKWHWHLDDRMTATGKDINPDVLGYIFEQYINDRAQMGAYYTKEDITEYIGRNTIIPYLMDAVRQKDEKLFKPDSHLWQFLCNSGDRYIYDAVKKGHDLPIPDEIAVGIDTTQPNLLERRKLWNNRTPEKFALPTEIWRETIERLQRYSSIKTKIENGEITVINDFITYNLDIRQFVYDYLASTPNHLFVEYFYDALQRVTILDPTCGSGAFLFAALNILEPLYEVCLSRMEEFHEQNPHLFNRQLQEVQSKYRSNIQYFIYKSIILRNLYGVDIMVEATEIAKLRLFLKMVAVVEVDRRDPNLGLDPLPDIDFNIRCGNTLVGYATEKELNRDLVQGDMFAIEEFKNKIHDEMDIVAHAYKRFKEIQLNQGEDMATFKQSKHQLKQRLLSLNNLLNHHMHTAVAVGVDYDAWLHSHQPFHWLAEFYEIINDNGGFDVIIGNPPYVEYAKIKHIYHIDNYKTIKSGNIYAQVIERCNELVCNAGIMGWIVPISVTCTDRTQSIQDFIVRNYFIYGACFDIFPSKLFEGVAQRVTILVMRKGKGLYTSNYRRWNSQERKSLFHTISFWPNDFYSKGWTPRINSNLSFKLIKNLRGKPLLLSYLYHGNSNIFVHRIINNFIKAIDFEPFCQRGNGQILKSDDFKVLEVERKEIYIIAALLNSSLFYVYWRMHGDGFHCGFNNIEKLPIVKELFEHSCKSILEKYTKKLILDFKNHSEIRIRNQVNTGEVKLQTFYIGKSKPIIDEIDKVLAKHYGFTEEELDFIINYDIKYRMGDELNEE